MSKYNPQQNLKALFESLKFSEKESGIYVVLLEVGSARAQDIAKRTGINRTTVYDILEVLLSKGLVSKYKKASSSYFNALDPKNLLSYLDREKEEESRQIEKRKEKVTELMPQLLSLQNIYPSRPKVQFYEGEKGMREAYEDTLTTNGMILAYANVETMHEGLPNFFPEYYKRRASKKIFIRAIVPQNQLSIERSRLDQQEMREIRFLPDEDMTFSPEVNIYNNKVLIASWKEKMAIITESKEHADLQKLAFDLVWRGLPRAKSF